MSAFSGTLQQCFERLRKSDQACLDSFIEFVEAHPATVSGWMFGLTKPPAGEFLVRSMLFFHLSGWKVTEFEDTDDVALGLAKLWMYKLVTVEDIREELGYTSSSNSGILKYIYGEREPTGSTKRLAAKLVDSWRYQIDHAEATLREHLLLPTDLPAVTGDFSSDAVEGLARRLTEIVPLVERVASNEFTDEDRDRLRELVGREQYVELAVKLNAMKSYRTRAAAREAGVI